MIKFDAKLCMEQLLRSLAYQKLITSFMEDYAKLEVDRPAKSTILSTLNKTYSRLVKEYKSISCTNSDGSLIDSFGLLASEACAEWVLVYLKQARDEIAMNICNLNRPTRNTLKNSIKKLDYGDCKIDFTKLPEDL